MVDLDTSGRNTGGRIFFGESESRADDDAASEAMECLLMV
jgi:hypothetical protein